jgi:hypothetical protein
VAGRAVVHQYSFRFVIHTDPSQLAVRCAEPSKRLPGPLRISIVLLIPMFRRPPVIVVFAPTRLRIVNEVSFKQHDKREVSRMTQNLLSLRELTNLYVLNSLKGFGPQKFKALHP